MTYDPLQTPMTSEPDPKHAFDFKVTPTVLDGCRLVIETSDISRVLCRRILDTEDEATRSALVQLGWTPPGESQWRPIETCPYDENVLFRYESGNIFQGFIYDQSIRDFVNCVSDSVTGKLTHWMPIPPAPEKEQPRTEP